MVDAEPEEDAVIAGVEEFFRKHFAHSADQGNNLSGAELVTPAHKCAHIIPKQLLKAFYYLKGRAIAAQKRKDRREKNTCM